MERPLTGDQSLVKQINKSIVFTTIVGKGPISRAQISKNTGLNKATVSTMVAELIDEQMIYEIGSSQSSGGRKPVMLYFNSHAGYAVGVDLGVNYILGVLTDLSGNKMEEVHIPIEKREFNEVVESLKSVIQTLLIKAPESVYGVVGIGIGVPGIVDKEKKILFAPNLNWNNINLKEIIEKEYNIPTIIENEANSGAHGEQLYGAGKHISNLIYVSIGIGIGTGIIIDNKLYTGVSGISGEMGHITIEANGRKCSCGNRGCWELYASEQVILNDAKNSIHENSVLDFNGLVNEAFKGNPLILQLLNTLGENIGIGLTNIINTFNPEVIIIGNRISQFKNWISNPIEHILSERLLPYHKDKTEIRFSELGKHSCALGAASFAISGFLAEKKVSEQYK
ncbi:ROK family protein [Fredinandcohnia sp. QZ13]|uniref:ROK family transcriptional regulator n=1 Tax=Fredinandcohnia sp. QZ13 TaxID=3073144 RepID=UPI0028536E2D|nr:ROK family protein [Fredinandcohnia sp. QZ13]MDR4887730.1 ROK family protein [Fredinandcohnia sp. QZ13]